MIELQKLFTLPIELTDNLITLSDKSIFENQQQTNDVFSEKWLKLESDNGIRKLDDFQRKWYLELYGFQNEVKLQEFLQGKKIILDAGCGLGYKAAWFAKLAPESIVIGMDYSEAVYPASKNYAHIKNLFFVRGDIANTMLKRNSIDYVNCDQVIHHTENPKLTFKHLSDITAPNGEFACYVYAKKALPRELLDNYFRNFSKECNSEDLWEMAEALTIFGKKLAELKIEIEIPEIKLLQIKGGKYDLQRFIYWNFIKCFWNEELGYKNSISTNFDWYSPSNAFRYSEDEYREMIESNNLKIIYFHKEEACYSGRFKK